jgi:hypothetical protein
MNIRHAQPSTGVVSSRKESRPSTPAPDDTDHNRRSFSIDATPRPSISQPRPPDSSPPTADSLPPHSKRLGFFADKLSGASSHSNHQQSPSTSGHRASPVPFHSSSGLLPPRSHSRADSAPRDPPSSNMASSSSAANASKVHTSPSKVCSYYCAYGPTTHSEH